MEKAKEKTVSVRFTRQCIYEGESYDLGSIQDIPTDLYEKIKRLNVCVKNA